VRITAQLIRGATDEHLWAASFTNTMENVQRMNAVVTPKERTRLAQRKPVDREAYELYQQRL
jgi:TolB-like protein